MSCYIYRNNMKAATSFRICPAELILNSCINEDVAGWKLASDDMLIYDNYIELMIGNKYNRKPEIFV